MPIILPKNRKEILQNLQTDFIANIPESDPFLQESWILALLISIANREFDVYTQVRQMILQLFPNTAEGIFARQWGNLKGVDINAATSAAGFISVPGTIGTVVSEGTLWSNEEGSQYEALSQDYTIELSKIIVSNLISSGGIAQATTINEHHFSSGMTITITGADQSEYNISATITVLSTTEFKYEISGTPASPATGSIFAESTFVSVFVGAQDIGVITNLGSGAQLTLVNPVAGVDNTSYVQFTEIGGGADDETDDEYRARYLERYQNQTANFNEANIINTAKEIPGVTRVFVDGLKPEVGDVTVTFMRDNDDYPIPNPQEVQDVEDKLRTITPAHTPVSQTEGLIVKAPVAQNIDFFFTNLTPNTSTMQTAIGNSLTQFFKDKVNVSEDITQAAYTSAIFQTVDPATGKFVEFFTLSNPTGDISISDGSIGFLSSVIFTF